jgi:hypothetical protein
MSARMSATTRARFGAAIVAIAPAVMLAGLFAHPYIATLPDEEAVAEAVAADTTYWGLVHLTAAVASGLLVLAFLAIRSYLRDAGEERWSVLALPFIVVGGTLFAVLPGMEFVPLAAAEAGADAEAAQAALAPWFIPIQMTGAITFAVGVFAFAKGIANSRVLSRRLTWLVVGALVVMAVSRLVPVGAVQFYVQGAAGVVALWPLAYGMWKHPEATQPAGQTRPMPTT